MSQLDSLHRNKRTGVSDPGELYGLLATRLERIVRQDVRAPDAVIEDACQFAWSQFVSQCRRVRREAVLSWLTTTAVREACKLVRLGDREPSLEAAIELAGDVVIQAALPGPDELLDELDSLRLVALLPPRQQRLMWLRGLGLSYQEMAAHEGCTRRTVERQLLRARDTIRLARRAEG